MRVLVMGDSYSAGNGAGDYSGPAGCYRSGRDYAQDFAAILRGEPYSQPTSVTNAACSGAVTADFSHSRSGRPPELSYVNSSYDVIFLTIGGNDVDFSDVVKYCLIAKFRDGANCNPLLTNAEKLISNGTMRTRITGVLKAIHAKADPLAKIVLLGYPFLEGDTSYTLRSGHGDKAPIIKVGQRLHDIGVAADALDRSIVGSLNGTYAGSPFEFVSVQKLFDGPPYHGLYAKKNNPDRWMVQPFVDASLATYQTWYHPNPTGWSREARLLAATANVPKHPLNRPVITTTKLPSATVGKSYITQLTTADHRVGTWKITAGRLPAGLTLAGYTISGTPTAPGIAKFTLSFTDTYAQTATAAATLTVSGSGPVAQYAGHIVQWNGDTKAQKTAWYVTADLKRLWIPDTTTYNCLKSHGAPGPVPLSAANLDALPDQNGHWVPCGNQMWTSRELRRGMSLTSADGRFALVLQASDGNFVLYGPGGRALWASGRAADFVVMQGDGNLVGYTNAGVATWATNTAGSGATHLVVQSDGNLVLYAGSRAVWATGTNWAGEVGHIVQWSGDTKAQKTAWYVTPDYKREWIPDIATYNCLKSHGAPGPDVLAAATLNQLPDQNGQWVPCGDTMATNRVLRRGMSLQSADGRYILVLQASDGNFVLYGPGGRALWASGRAADFVVMQGDGNLVGYTNAGVATWATNTAGSGGNRLVMQDDGNVVIYSPSRAVWATST